MLTGYLSILKSDKQLLSDHSSSSLEALAGCEVSPIHSNNVGYCNTLLGSNEGVCTTQGSGSEPRCSGNY